MSDALDFSHAAMTSGPALCDPPVIEIRDDKPVCVWRGKTRWPSVGRAMKRMARVYAPWLVEERTPEAEARQERGKRIHEVIGWLDKGLRVGYEPFYQPYIDGWMAGCAELGIDEWEEVETPRARVIDEKHCIFGVPDRVALSRVVELKTVENIKSRQEASMIQTAGYMWITGRDQGSVIWVDPYGGHHVEPVGERAKRRWQDVVNEVSGSEDEGDE